MACRASINAHISRVFTISFVLLAFAYGTRAADKVLQAAAEVSRRCTLCEYLIDALDFEAHASMAIKRICAARLAAAR